MPTRYVQQRPRPVIKVPGSPPPKNIEKRPGA